MKLSNKLIFISGLMGEGLVASIRDELTEYYRSVALLQSQVTILQLSLLYKSSFD